MKQCYINCTLILGFFSAYKVSCNPQAVNPAALPQQATTASGQLPLANGAGPVCDDSAVSTLYAMIPNIIQACITIQTQISQGFQFTPSGQSPMDLILQNVQWQDMLVTCDMIIKTKQMSDQIQAASGSGQASASGTMSASVGGLPNAPGAVPATPGAGDPSISAGVSLPAGPPPTSTPP